MLALRSASTSFHRQAAPALFRLSSTLASRTPNKPKSPSAKIQQSYPVLTGASRSFVDALTHEKNLLSCQFSCSEIIKQALELERNLVTFKAEKVVIKSCCAIEECVEEAMVLEKEVVTNTSPFQVA